MVSGYGQVSLLHPLALSSSLPEVFCKKGVWRNFVKFIGKHLCQSLFFNKIAGLKPATWLRKTLWHRRFPVNLAKFPRTPFLTEHLRWRLLRVAPQKKNQAYSKTPAINVCLNRKLWPESLLLQHYNHFRYFPQKNNGNYFFVNTSQKLFL